MKHFWILLNRLNTYKLSAIICVQSFHQCWRTRPCPFCAVGDIHLCAMNQPADILPNLIQCIRCPVQASRGFQSCRDPFCLGLHFGESTTGGEHWQTTAHHPQNYRLLYSGLHLMHISLDLSGYHCTHWIENEFDTNALVLAHIGL